MISLRSKTMVVAVLLLASAVYPSSTLSSGQADRTVVAEVIGRTVYDDELVPREFADEQKARLAPADYAAWYERMRQDRLRALIWTAVFNDFAEKRHIEPSEEEIESQIRSTKKFMAEDRARQERDREALIVELTSPSLSEKRRKEAEQQLDILERSRQMDEKIAKMQSGPDNEAIQKKAERNVARAWVRQWKVNQVLYQEYGGRIVFQQAGWEPIDAYRAVLEQYEKKKAFVVHDPSLRDAVYSYFSLTFTYAGKKQAKFYFEKPYWERTQEEMKNAGF